MAEAAAMEEYLPCVAMVTVQCIYAAVALWCKAVFTGGMSTMVFVVYRQAVATIVLVPIAIVVNRRKLKQMISPGMAGFSLVFVAVLVGITLNLLLLYQGINLGSSSMAMALENLLPGITFFMAASVGLESVNIRELRTLAKILGTVVCLGGAMVMAFFKGPKLLSDVNIVLHTSAGSRWMTGALLVVGSTTCWSLWFLLQVPICKWYMDPLTLSTWTCLLSTLQSALIVLVLQPDPNVWKIRSVFELSGCLFVGVAGSGVTFFLQAWCIFVRGPLYSAMFNPLCTVITTVLAAIFLSEELHVGSLLGATAIIGGLYVVLWGKAGDTKGKGKSAQEHREDVEAMVAQLESQLDTGNSIEEPLLAGGNQVEK